MYGVVSETAHVQGTGCFLGVTESYIRERATRRHQELRLKLKAKSENSRRQEGTRPDEKRNNRTSQTFQ